VLWGHVSGLAAWVDHFHEFLFCSEEEMEAFLERQRDQLFQLGKRIDAKAATICRWNYATRKCINTFQQTEYSNFSKKLPHQ
jgi:hypothetical protein